MYFPAPPTTRVPYGGPRELLLSEFTRVGPETLVKGEL